MSEDHDTKRAIAEIVAERRSIAERNLRLRLMGSTTFFRDLLGDLLEAGAVPTKKAERLRNLDEHTIEDALTTRELMHLAIKWGITSSAGEFWRKHKKRDDLWTSIREAKASRILKRDEDKMETVVEVPAESEESQSQHAVNVPHPEMIRKQRRQSLDRLQVVMSVPRYEGDAFGTRGTYDTGMHYSFRATLRSPQMSPQASPFEPIQEGSKSLEEGSAMVPSITLGGEDSVPPSPIPGEQPESQQAYSSASRVPSSNMLDVAFRRRPSSSERLTGGSRPSSPDGSNSDLRVSRGRLNSLERFPVHSLPTVMPVAPPWDSEEIMNVNDFVERNGMVDQVIMGDIPQDGERYIEQALGIRELLVKDKYTSAYADLAELRRCDEATVEKDHPPFPIHDEASVPDSPPKAFLERKVYIPTKIPMTSPILLRAGLASRMKPVSKGDVYWKPLSRQQRKPLTLDPEQPPPPPDPIADQVVKYPPVMRSLVRRLLIAEESMDKDKIYGKRRNRPNGGHAPQDQGAETRTFEEGKEELPRSRGRNQQGTSTQRAHASQSPGLAKTSSTTRVPPHVADANMVKELRQAAGQDVIALARRIPDSMALVSGTPSKTSKMRKSLVAAAAKSLATTYSSSSPFVTWA